MASFNKLFSTVLLAVLFATTEANPVPDIANGATGHIHQVTRDLSIEAFHPASSFEVRAVMTPYTISTITDVQHRRLEKVLITPLRSPRGVRWRLSLLLQSWGRMRHPLLIVLALYATESSMLTFTKSITVFQSRTRPRTLPSRMARLYLLQATSLTLV
jgi:hypothetical protein